MPQPPVCDRGNQSCSTVTPPLPPLGTSPWWVPCAPGVRLSLIPSQDTSLPSLCLPPALSISLTASSVTHMPQIPASGSAGRDLGLPG